MSVVRRSRDPLDPLNLARRPFANGRPVVRIALLLGVLGTLLLVENIAIYWRYLEDSATQRAERAGLVAEREQIERRINDLFRQLESFDLDRQNLQVGFLNQRIAERKFSWGTLLDRLARELPGEVRLVSLRPKSGDAKGRTSVRSLARGKGSGKSAGSGERIQLVIEGQAKSVEAMLRFVDHLFARAEFADPDPQSQQQDDKGLINFKLSVDYLPEVAAIGAAGASSLSSPQGTARSLPVAPNGAVETGGER